MGLGPAEIAFTKLPGQEFDLPPVPRWVVMGRSNVGKSSLLNSLIHPQILFRSGSTPGVTRGVIAANIYIGKRFLQVCDLPGWGYAQRSKHEQVEWQEFGDKFKYQSDAFTTQWLWLLDPRRPPEEDDISAQKWLGSVNWFFVFTKADQIKNSQRRKIEKDWEHIYAASTQAPLWVSPRYGEGVDLLQKRARAFLLDTQEIDKLKK